MEERLHELEARLARLEAATTRLLPATLPDNDGGLTLTGPLRLVNAAGATLLGLSGDSDGGWIHVNDASGQFRVLLGSGPDGGWVDVIQAGSESGAIHLSAHAEGGTMEYTQNGACYAVSGERYWPPDGEAL